MSHASRLSSPFFIALAVSLAVHAMLAAALALYLRHVPSPDEPAQLDLTSVELSFAETAGGSAAAVASAPSTPAETAPPPPPADAAPPPPPADAAPPPRQTAPRLPLPEEVPSLLPPVDAGHEKGDVRRETRDERTRQTRIDAPPKPRRSIRPDYPRESRLRGEHGDVTLEIDVAADGSVSHVRLVHSTGYPLLDEAAVRAARTARFTPAKSGGRPVASTARLTLAFRLK